MNFRFSLLAQNGLGEYQPPAGLPSADNDLMPLFEKATDSFLLIAAAIAAIFLIIGGIQYAVAAGDEDKQKHAKATIKWTVFGLILALVAYSIVFFITKVLG